MTVNDSFPEDRLSVTILFWFCDELDLHDCSFSFVDESSFASADHALFPS
jgi:hypothetical protein